MKRLRNALYFFVLLTVLSCASTDRQGRNANEAPPRTGTMTDKEIIESQVKESLDALQEEDVDKAFFYHTKDFATKRGQGLDATIETILDFQAGGFLDALRIDYKNLNVEIDGDTASVRAILLDWPFGTMTFEMELERRGWLWVVTHSTDF